MIVFVFIESIYKQKLDLKNIVQFKTLSIHMIYFTFSVFGCLVLQGEIIVYVRFRNLKETYKKIVTL